MYDSLIVNFAHATREGVVEGSRAGSDLDDIQVSVGDIIGVMDSGAGPYEAEVIEVDGDTIRVRAPALSVPPTRPGLADAADIERWADSPKARHKLPKLVRQLLADTPGVTGLSMRAGSGVDLPGWDGRVDGGVGAPYVPSGLSCWEMGTGHNPGSKAQADYRKRTDDPLGVDPGATTFVFVTPRRWSQKDKWVVSRRAEDIWRDVRVLDADDLEGWLGSRYGLHVWFSEILGCRPGEMETLERWWSRWSAATDPPFPPNLLLAGRRGQADMLRNALRADPSVTRIKAGSRDEALAFAAVTLRSQDTDANGVIVSTLAAWERCMSGTGRSVLIPRFEGAEVTAAIRSGHHVALAMGTGDIGDAIELPRVGRSEARSAFEAIGVPSDKADRYAVRARLSLLSLRRSLSINPLTARPGWAQSPDTDILAVLVLVGAWSQNRDADREIVERIAGRNMDEIERRLQAWENTEDPPFRRSGISWRLTNPEDAWSLLRNLITKDGLGRWSQAAMEVLGTPDPVLDLPPADRFAAPIHGIEQRWSSDLRGGLAQGLALLATLELPRPVSGKTGSDHAGLMIYDLLSRSGDDATGKLWQSLSDVLPMLAEAAPGVFLEAVRRDSGEDSPLLAKMFTDSEDEWQSVGGSSPHTGLLWALETLCWSDEHFPAALDSLMRLAEIDPGGRLANRPIDSASLVLMPWRPQTVAPLGRRLGVLEGVLHRYGEGGQEMSSGLLSRSALSLNIHRPRFRDWEPDQGQVTTEESKEASRAIVDRALAAIKDSPCKLVRWTDELPNLVVEAQKSVIAAVRGVDVDELNDDERCVLWKALDGLLNKYAGRATLEQFVFEEGIQHLEEAINRIRPETVDILPEVRSLDHTKLFGWDLYPEEDRQAVLKERQTALDRLYNWGQSAALMDLATRVARPELVGKISADIFGDQLADSFLPLLDTNETELQLAWGWARRMAETGEIEWVEETLAANPSLSHQVQARLFLVLPPGSYLWKVLDDYPTGVMNLYWRQISKQTIADDDFHIYLDRLIENDRPQLALETLWYKLRESKNLVIDRTIEYVLSSLAMRDRIYRDLDVYYIRKLMDRLIKNDPDSDMVLVLEFKFFQLFSISGRSPTAIYHRLRRDPQFFVDLVCTAHPRAGDEDSGLAIPHDVAWSILQKLRRMPGIFNTGEDNYRELRDWVFEAHRMLEERQRTEIGDLYIGNLLSGAPSGNDGVWPSEPIRDLLETMDNDQLDRGLLLGFMNRRGVTVRDPYEGGAQERALADQYRTWAGQIEVCWWRAGQVLRQLAGSYEEDARREDERAERLAELE